MERLKAMKESLISCVQAQIGGNLKDVDAKELGEAVDMIKDLEEAIYYCTITKEMEDYKKEKEYEEKHGKNHQQHYYTPYMKYPDLRDMDRDYGKMYYDETRTNTRGAGANSNVNRSYYTENPTSYPMEVRDYREGRSPMSRRSYMESKELHKDKNVHMRELEKYVKELAEDVTEMVEGASPEEKVLLQQRLTTLANKIK